MQTQTRAPLITGDADDAYSHALFGAFARPHVLECRNTWTSIMSLHVVAMAMNTFKASNHYYTVIHIYHLELCAHTRS